MGKPELNRCWLDGFVKKWTWVSQYGNHHEKVYMDLAPIIKSLLAVLDAAEGDSGGNRWCHICTGRVNVEGHKPDCPVAACIEAGLGKV